MLLSLKRILGKLLTFPHWSLLAVLIFSGLPSELYAQAWSPGWVVRLTNIVDTLVTTGTAPVLSVCGTTPTVAGNGMAGKVTIGTGATTSCTVTFGSASTNAPACTIAGDNTAVTYAATTTTTVLTITSSADMASDVISYVCVRY